MGESFTNRKKPLEYESLSAYLSRAANANGRKIESVIKYSLLPSESQEILPKKMYQIDVFPKSFLDISKLSTLLRLESQRIESMTFTPIIEKLITKENANDKVHLHSLMQNSIITEHRRFCLKCIEQNGCYKLLWQVKDIKICNEHLIPLESKCPKCHEELPYYFDTLYEHICPLCGDSFIKKNKGLVLVNLNNQNKIVEYRDWIFLSDNSKELAPIIQGLSKEQSLAVRLLFASQQQKDEIDIDSVSFFRSAYRNALIKKVNSISNNYQIRLFIILKFLKYMNMSIEEFSQLEIPESYIQSVLRYYIPEDGSVGPCLSPWCKSFNKVDSIKVITGHHLYYEKYEMGAVCTECNIKFGYSRVTGEWESIDNEVDLIWNKVKPLFEKGLTRWQIINELKIGEEKVYRVFGYLLYHKLLPKDILKKNKPQNKLNYLVNKFKVLMVLQGDMVSLAKEQFGWSKTHYYFYLADPKIQEFMNFNADEYRKKYGSCQSKGTEYWEDRVKEAVTQCLEEDVDIEIIEIAKRLKCTPRSIYRYNMDVYIETAIEEQKKRRKVVFEKRIIEKADKFIEQMRQEFKKTSLKEIFENAGTYDKIMRSKYPDITAKLLDKVNIHNGWVDETEYQDDYRKIEEGIRFLEANGRNIKYSSLKELTGLSEFVVKKRLKNSGYFLEKES